MHACAQFNTLLLEFRCVVQMRGWLCTMQGCLLSAHALLHGSEQRYGCCWWLPICTTVPALLLRRVRKQSGRHALSHAGHHSASASRCQQWRPPQAGDGRCRRRAGILYAGCSRCIASCSGRRPA